MERIKNKRSIGYKLKNYLSIHEQTSELSTKLRNINYQTSAIGSRCSKMV